MQLNMPAKELRQLKRSMRQFRHAASLQYFEEANGVVQGGCLCGLKLMHEHSGGASDLIAKLMGFYEQHNQRIFQASDRRTLVDIGAADGYWGVGLVYAGCFDRSICFEQRPKGRRAIRDTALTNGVRDRVAISGRATTSSVRDTLEGHKPDELFFLIDIEGNEFDLLTFDFLNDFRTSEFLIELYSDEAWLGSEKEERLLRDAKMLFDTEIVTDTTRDVLQLREELRLPDDLTWLLASEGREYPTRWLHLKPRTVPAEIAPPRIASDQLENRGFGTLWLGDEMGPLEQACLLSMREHGYDPVVFSYAPVRNVPEGIETADARELYEPNRVVRHFRYRSTAIHADVFRYHMVRKTGMIWLDTDMYMVRPARELLSSVAARDGFCVGRTGPDDPTNRMRHSLYNNAVFGLPKDSVVLGMLSEIFDEGTQITQAWGGLSAFSALNEAVAEGREKPFGSLQWGRTGPRALTSALEATGEARFAHEAEAFYPVGSRQIPELLRDGTRLSDFVTPNSFGLHLWGRDFRAVLAQIDGNSGPCAAREILGHLF